MNLKIFQIYYNSLSKEKLDSAFVPYDNSNGNAKWFEYGVFRENYFNQNYKSAEYTGFLSWKFKDKTKINSSNDFVSFINENADNDVYFLNPFQGLTNQFRNVWDCGEYFHPGLKEIVNYIFQKINYKIDLDRIVNSHADTLYCNYWVGNQKFWKSYIDFCEPVYTYIESSNDSFLHEKILRQADAGIRASFIPFIMERMFSSLLFIDKKKFKAKPMLFRPLFTYSITLYPVYLQLNALKSLELEGKNVVAKRSKLLPILNEYTLMASKERQIGKSRNFLSRILFMIRTVFKLLNPFF